MVQKLARSEGEGENNSRLFSIIVNGMGIPLFSSKRVFDCPSDFPKGILKNNNEMIG